MYSNLTQNIRNYINSDSRSFRCKISVSTDGSNYSELECNVINAELTSGYCGNEGMTIGTAYAAQFTAVLQSVPIATVLENQYIKVEWTGMATGGESFSIPAGYFKISEAKEDYGQWTITAYDRMMYAVSGSFTISINEDITINNLLGHALELCGIDKNNDLIYILDDMSLINGNIDFNNLNADEENGSIVTLTNRNVIGQCAALLGANVYIDRNNKVVVKQIKQHDVLQIGASRYMTPLDRKGTFYTSRLTIKKSEDVSSTTYYEQGSGSGITISNQFINQTLFDAVKSKVVGFNYNPANATIFGDPRIDPGDLLVITDVNNQVISIPCCEIKQTFDGGISTNVTAGGTTETSESSSGATVSAAIGNINEGLYQAFQIMSTKVDTAYLTATYATINELNVAKSRITTLETNTLTADFINSHFADIDLANISNGAIKQAMIDNGAIGTVQIADGSITDSKIVTLTANKINAGTLSVERLIINGSNESIVYALNNMGDLTSTHYDSIDGGALTERSITADRIVTESITSNELASNSVTANKILAGAVTASKINVSDLSALNATIGGWNIGSTSINAGNTYLNSSGRIQSQYDDNNFSFIEGGIFYNQGYDKLSYKSCYIHNGAIDCQRLDDVNNKTGGHRTVITSDVIMMYGVDANDLLVNLNSTSNTNFIKLDPNGGGIYASGSDGVGSNSNLYIKSWNGIGFIDSCNNVCAIDFDLRSATINARDYNSDGQFSSRDVWSFGTGVVDNFDTFNFVTCSDGMTKIRFYTNGNSDFAGNVKATNGVYDNNNRLISGQNIISYLTMPNTEYIHVQTFNSGSYGVNVWQSDKKFKRNISDSKINCTNKIRQIMHRQYEWIDSGKYEPIGYVAQELEEIMSGFVIKIKQQDGTYTYQVDERRIIPVITKCLQETLDRIDTLEGELKILKESM